MASPTAIAAYLTLFLVVGAVFLFVNLFVGWLVRPNDPHAEKKEIYECGEPAIGSSFVQFDLRFYVVALVFIVFDAEVEPRICQRIPTHSWSSEISIQPGTLLL